MLDADRPICLCKILGIFCNIEKNQVPANVVLNRDYGGYNRLLLLTLVQLHEKCIEQPAQCQVPRSSVVLM